MVKQWQLYFMNLNPVIGSEQAGVRPGIVISADYTNELNQVTVIPLTSMKKSYTTILSKRGTFTKGNFKIT